MSEEPVCDETTGIVVQDINSKLLFFDTASLDHFKKWIKTFERFGGQRSIEWIEDSKTEVKVKIYTDVNKYTIYANLYDNGNNYLSCVASTRKPRAGETWTRGNDLKDGPLTFDTWYGILTDIIAYETVKVNPKDPRRGVDEV